MDRNPMPAANGCRSFCLGEDCPLRALGWTSSPSARPAPRSRPARVTDGPFAETKEMVGALTLPARRPAPGSAQDHRPVEAETLA